VVGYLAAFKGLDLSIERTDLSAFTHYQPVLRQPRQPTAASRATGG
jgi:chitinase